jgi:hypothetical protein
MASQKLIQYFWALVEQLPSLLALIGCIVFALMRWKRHPKVSLLLAAGLGLLVVHAFVFILVYDLVPRLIIKPENYLNMDSMRRIVYLVLGLIANSAIAIAFALLLAAVFTQRNEPAPIAPQPG